MIIKKLALGLAAVAATLSYTASAYAEDAGDWLVRGRIVNVSPNDDSGEVTGIAGSGVGVDSDTTVEVDLSYFLTKNWALELIAATTTHDISGTGAIAGLGNIVETKVLPPTLNLQYHNHLSEDTRMYFGAGINYTVFYDEEGKGAFAGADVDLDNSVGLSTQLGVDYDINDDWFINLDVKYIFIDTEAEIRPGDGSVLKVDADIDPWVVGVGIGTRF